MFDEVGPAESVNLGPASSTEIYVLVSYILHYFSVLKGYFHDFLDRIRMDPGDNLNNKVNLVLTYTPYLTRSEVGRPHSNMTSYPTKIWWIYRSWGMTFSSMVVKNISSDQLNGSISGSVLYRS